MLALVTAAVDPKTEIGLDVSVLVTAPNAEVVPDEPPPKMDVVSAFGAVKEEVPKMFPVEALGTVLDGEQILNDPKRFDVASVVEVGMALADAVVTVAEDDVTDANENPEEVVSAVAEVVTTAGEDVTAGAIDVVVDVTVVEAGVVLIEAATVPNKGFPSLVSGSDLTDRSVGLLAAAANEKPLLAPPKDNPVLLAEVVAGALTDPNKVDVVEVVDDVL